MEDRWFRLGDRGRYPPSGQTEPIAICLRTSCMWKPKISLRIAFLIFTLLSVCVSVVAKHEYDRREAERISEERQLELEETRERIDSNQIAAGMTEVDYLAIASPCETQVLGEYTEYAHGFPGGLGHGLTITVKNKILVKARSWSCLGGQTFFNTKTDVEESEVIALRDLRFSDEPDSGG